MKNKSSSYGPVHGAVNRNNWILCSEKMPSHPIGGTWQIFVLCHVKDHQRPRLLSYYTCDQPRWYDEQDNQFYGEVLAWMELPDLPNPTDQRAASAPPASSCSTAVDYMTENNLLPCPFCANDCANIGVPYHHLVRQTPEEFQS